MVHKQAVLAPHKCAVKGGQPRLYNMQEDWGMMEGKEKVALPAHQLMTGINDDVTLTSYAPHQCLHTW